MQPERRLIVTADDFGASFSVNEGIEQAHSHGILTAASLMVTGDAVDDAVARARRLPRLGVGLHLVLVEGRPALPPEQVPALVGPDGRFRADMVASAFRIFFSPAARRQLEAEVTAQFTAFAATGLPLDHVNAHKHFHLHPTIAATLLKVGRRFGMRGGRAPVEPAAMIRAIKPERAGGIDIAAPWARMVAARMRRAGLLVPDQVFGLAFTGALDTDRLRALATRLPPGLTEIYAHPAASDDWHGHAPGYRYRDELAALCDEKVRAALAYQGVESGSFMTFVERSDEFRDRHSSP